MTLTEFLLARIAEAEALAERANAANFDGVWDDEGVCDEQGGHVGLPPTRVLADCEAKRRIVEIHAPFYADYPYPRRPGEPDSCRTCGTVGEYDYDYPCDTLKALALPYADHPDYREEWKP